MARPAWIGWRRASRMAVIRDEKTLRPLVKKWLGEHRIETSRREERGRAVWGIELRADVAGLYSFTRQERLSLPQDFRKAIRYGRRYHSKSFTLYMLKTEGPCHRLGIVVKREIGPATYRNRLKRYCREFFRLHKHQIEGPFDIVVFVKKGCIIRRYHEVEKELKGLLVRESRDV